MSETARQIIEDAMSKISVFPAESSIENDEFESFVRGLNRMMASWESKGYKLGFTKINSITDPVTVPDYALDAIIYNLAVRMAADFNDGNVPAIVFKTAKDEMIAVRKNALRTPPVQYHELLPFGSGNFSDSTEEEIYQDLEPRLFLTNTGLTVTISVAGTPVVIGTNWVEQSANGFDTNSAGKATFTGNYGKIQFAASIFAQVASSTDELTFYFAKNGMVFPESAVTIKSTAGTDQEILISNEIEVWKNDYIEIYCQNDDTTANIVISSARIRI